MAKKKNFIQKAIKHPGALTKKAEKAKLIKKGEELTNADLAKLAAKAKKDGDTETLKQVNLAKTLGKLPRKKKKGK